jgi:hypothetical protein
MQKTKNTLSELTSKILMKAEVHHLKGGTENDPRKSEKFQIKI